MVVLFLVGLHVGFVVVGCGLGDCEVFLVGFVLVL